MPDRRHSRDRSHRPGHRSRAAQDLEGTAASAFCPGPGNATSRGARGPGGGACRCPRRPASAFAIAAHAQTATSDSRRPAPHCTRAPGGAGVRPQTAAPPRPARRAARSIASAAPCT
eukprot:4880106-Prymnesium_polylepis.2